MNVKLTKKSQLKKSVLFSAVASALFYTSTSYAFLPSGGQVTSGSGSINVPSRGQMVVQQNSDRLVIDWQSFNVAKNYGVTFKQPGEKSIVLNRVVGNSTSSIVGNINANGQVVLVNPNGVFMKSGAKINSAGFIATTRAIDNADFMNGNLKFTATDKTNTSVVNQAAITVSNGGYVVLAADNVTNTGRINTPSGKTLLAATKTVSLDLEGNGLKSYLVDGETFNAMVRNNGQIRAANGQVNLTALGKDMAMNTVINNTGYIEASGFTRTDGNVIVNGGASGQVNMAGQIVANNVHGDGGNVRINGKHITLDDYNHIDVTGIKNGGSVSIGQTGTQTVKVMKMSSISASSLNAGKGGVVDIYSDGILDFRGAIDVRGGTTSGNGGLVHMKAKEYHLGEGTVDLSAPHGKEGTWIRNTAL
ncbi:filamentous hemagglutinin N-terminal domain-containing protein [Salmonella enterica subsp. salamae]|nr:filamentous hemagglutinin N-terminal domain-containing protein [Salmonella enterica subsp. salamae]EDW5993852.1 filamentous hemagglutinin N-terminal domain-containing protein [Salmonella enterica subsp. salamae]